jgi:hypothetical protein
MGSTLERMTQMHQVSEYGAREVDLLAFEDLAQLLLVKPGAGRA